MQHPWFPLVQEDSAHEGQLSPQAAMPEARAPKATRCKRRSRCNEEPAHCIRRVAPANPSYRNPRSNKPSAAKHKSNTMEATARFTEGEWHDKIFFLKDNADSNMEKGLEAKELQAKDYNRRLIWLLRGRNGENSQYYHSLSSDFIFYGHRFMTDAERFSPWLGWRTILHVSGLKHLCRWMCYHRQGQEKERIWKKDNLVSLSLLNGRHLCVTEEKSGSRWNRWVWRWTVWGCRCSFENQQHVESNFRHRNGWDCTARVCRVWRGQDTTYLNTGI